MSEKQSLEKPPSIASMEWTENVNFKRFFNIHRSFLQEAHLEFSEALWIFSLRGVMSLKKRIK